MAMQVQLSWEERQSIRARKRPPHPMRDGAAPWRDEVRTTLPPTFLNRMKDRESLATERAHLQDDVQKSAAGKRKTREDKDTVARMSIPPANGWALEADLPDF